MNLEFKVFTKRITSYRNIATCSPSQNLFDDLTPAKHWDLLSQHENASSGINHLDQKKSRCFQYGDTSLSLYVFKELNWNYGRFGDGKEYGVWYGALEEETSIQEIIYHRLRESIEFFHNPKIPDAAIIHQRMMIKAQCTLKKCVDLRLEKEIQEKLVSEDYVFCQKLGRKALEEEIDGYLTPSARCKGGSCTPIFSSKAIKDGFSYYFDIVIQRDLRVSVVKSEVKEWAIPKEWSL